MTSKEFQQMIVEAREDFTDLQIAAFCKVAISTVERWASGESCAAPLLRRPVAHRIGDLRAR
jgi:hypothetical protein